MQCTINSCVRLYGMSYDTNRCEGGTTSYRCYNICHLLIDILHEYQVPVPYTWYLIWYHCMQRSSPVGPYLYSKQHAVLML